MVDKYSGGTLTLTDVYDYAGPEGVQVALQSAPSALRRVRLLMINTHLARNSATESPPAAIKRSQVTLPTR